MCSKGRIYNNLPLDQVKNLGPVRPVPEPIVTQFAGDIYAI